MLENEIKEDSFLSFFKKLSYQNKINYVSNYLKEKISIIDDNFDMLVKLLINKIENADIDISLIFQIENYNQLIVLSKFNIFLNVEENLNGVMFFSKTIFPIESIINVKEKYILKLVEMLKLKGSTFYEEYLEVALKLYFIFGFDNAKKIIEDKFSKLNDASLKRIVEFNFKKSRKEFRIENQDAFYHANMENEIIQALNKNDNKIFKKLLFEPNREKIDKLKVEFLKLSYDKEKIRKKIIDCINEREFFEKQKLYEYIKIRVDNKIRECESLDIRRLFKLLENIDFYHILKCYNQDLIDRLSIFLLGNMRKDNDCLFRLILNDEALALNDCLNLLINNYDLLEIVMCDTELSLNSILDVIDVLRMNLYELRPNEQDITLETLTRVINSTDFRTSSEVDVAEQMCRVHVERKKKVCATIPSVNGTIKGYRYFVAPFDAEYLLAAGNDAKNCLRFGGYGQEFLEYCLKNENAVFIYVIDPSGKKYVCPTVRSGNAINCNGIDPMIEPEKVDDILKVLSTCFKEIIETSYDSDRNHYENIEVATITDLYLIEYFENGNFEEYILDKKLPLNYECHCDYNCSDIKHYILAKSSTYNFNHYYLSDDKFYQKRDKDYEFNISEEIDYEKLSIIINSIYYSSIDFQKISDKEKYDKKRNYENLNVYNFRYVIGNKDWFVAIDSEFNIISCLLPYDLRARKHYIKALMHVAGLAKDMLGEDYGGKCLRKIK